MKPSFEEHPEQTTNNEQKKSRASITITQDGPYIVKGGVPLIQQAISPVGGHREYVTLKTFPVQQTYALCRCGHTKTPPFCDGTHESIHFDGTETAGHSRYTERADIYRGPGVTLLDDNRCAFARFCHRDEGDVWTLTENSRNQHIKDEAIHASSECPAGRLIHVDTESKKVYEPRHKPSISLLEDIEQGVSAPLFVRGGIPLFSADGTQYERRNRYALCRCGASQMKPFCDAMHMNTRYHDGLSTKAE